MMRMVESTAGKDAGAPKMEAHVLPKQTLEVNPRHAVVIALHALAARADAEPAVAAPLARLVAEQLLDNALIAAGLVDDPRSMLPRLAALLEAVAGLPGAAAAYPGAAAIEAARFTSGAEAEEREQLAVGQEVADEIARVAGKGAGGAK
jgi:hypothetical protein